MKLLIADDNAETRKLIRSVVGSLHTIIYESSNGADAVKSYAVNKPDVVLMDIEMTGMDGITAMQQILARFPAAKIVIVTAFDNEKLRQRARDAGALNFVQKDNLLVLRKLLAEEYK